MLITEPRARDVHAACSYVCSFVMCGRSRRQFTNIQYCNPNLTLGLFLVPDEWRCDYIDIREEKSGGGDESLWWI